MERWVFPIVLQKCTHKTKNLLQHFNKDTMSLEIMAFIKKYNVLHNRY